MAPAGIGSVTHACLKTKFQFRDTRVLIPTFSGRENRGAYIITPRHGTAPVSKLQQYAAVTKTGTNR
jgi:hypothetical protein